MTEMRHNDDNYTNSRLGLGLGLKLLYTRCRSIKYYVKLHCLDNTAGVAAAMTSKHPFVAALYSPSPSVPTGRCSSRLAPLVAEMLPGVVVDRVTAVLMDINATSAITY